MNSSLTARYASLLTAAVLGGLASQTIVSSLELNAQVPLAQESAEEHASNVAADEKDAADRKNFLKQLYKYQSAHLTVVTKQSHLDKVQKEIGDMVEAGFSVKTCFTNDGVTVIVLTR